MKTPNFREMQPEAFKTYQPRTDEELAAHHAEAEFREWCAECEEDPQDEGARERYEEIQDESGPKFWEQLNDDERAGWEDNIIKSGE
jgi:hypothetical protein